MPQQVKGDMMYPVVIALLNAVLTVVQLLPFAALLAVFSWLAILGNAWAIVPMVLLPWSLFLALKR